ncbi:MAG: hypothetical protein V5A34_05690 [Halapricum sp.]
MSTTTSTQSHGSRALRLFDDLLFENPEICSTCYARIRDRTEHDASAGRLGTGNRPTETLERAGSGTIGQDVEIKDAYGAKRDYHARTYCGVCGSPSGMADSRRIASRQQALRRTDRIVRRLHEQGYYLDVEALYDAVEHLKAQPDNQGKEREIYASAVYLALQRGSTAPDVPGRVEPGPFSLAQPPISVTPD